MPTEATGRAASIARSAVQGKAARVIATEMNLSKSTVDFHLKRLVGKGILRVAKRVSRGAIVYAAGPHYEATVGPEARPHKIGRVGGASGAVEGVVPVRVHRGGWAWPVRWIGALVDGVGWSRRWSTLGEGKRTTDYRVVVDGWGFWLKLGEVPVLMVEPPNELVFEPEAVRAARARRAGEAKRRAVAFVEAHGAQLYAVRGYEFAPTEFARELPNSKPFGRPGEDLVWVDGSPEDGAVEVETQDAEVGAAFLEVPELVKGVRKLSADVALLQRFAEAATTLELARIGRTLQAGDAREREGNGAVRVVVVEDDPAYG